MNLRDDLDKANILYYFKHISCCHPTTEELHSILEGKLSLKDWGKKHMEKKECLDTLLANFQRQNIEQLVKSS